MRQPTEMPTTAYALLGLLSFGRDMTGYELKQFADNTLRFYWVSPAMSQIYTELRRLEEHGLVESTRNRDGGRVTTTYRINEAGTEALTAWLRTSDVSFPVLKHPIALRLLLGHLVDKETVSDLLERYLALLDAQRADLQAVLDSIRGNPAFEYPAEVAGWGLAYYDSERAITESILDNQRPRSD